MYLAGLVIFRFFLKWFQKNIHAALSPVRIFRDDRLAMIEVDNTFYSDILSRCVDMQKEVASKNYFSRFFMKIPNKLEACGETSNAMLFYVDIGICCIIAMQMAVIFCHCKKKEHPPAFPSPPTPPHSPPPTDKKLRKENKKEETTTGLRKRPVVYNTNMDV